MSVKVAFSFCIPCGLKLIHSRAGLPVPHPPAALPGETMLSPSQGWSLKLAICWGFCPGPRGLQTVLCSVVLRRKKKCLLSKLQGNNLLQPCVEALAGGKPMHYLPSWMPLLDDPRLLQSITAPGRQLVWGPPPALAGL